MKKGWNAFIAIIVLALVFFAGSFVAPERGAAATIKVGGAGMGYKFVLVSHGSSGDPYHSVVKQGMEDAAAVYGVKAEMLFSEGDNAKEVDMMEQAIASNPASATGQFLRRVLGIETERRRARVARRA